MKPTKAWCVFDQRGKCYPDSVFRLKRNVYKTGLVKQTDTVGKVVILKAADYEAMQARVAELEGALIDITREFSGAQQCRKIAEWVLEQGNE